MFWCSTKRHISRRLAANGSNFLKNIIKPRPACCPAATEKAGPDAFVSPVKLEIFDPSGQQHQAPGLPYD
jgi:hypothetical protein